MVFGFAPGYRAETTTVGGTTSGYSLTGRRNREMAPTSRMTVDSTPAKIGRLMKKSEKFMASAEGKPVCGGGGRGSEGRLGRHFHAGPHVHQAIDDDALAGTQPGGDDPFAADVGSQRHRAVKHGVSR